MSNVTFAELAQIGKLSEGPKVLCLDIETFPIEFYGWGMFNNNFSVKQIKRDWSCMSFSAEWLHDPGNFYADNRHETDVRDDLRLLTLLWCLLDMADFVLARNGKKFDMRKIRARMAIHGFKPFSPVQIIDPMLLNRDEFAFTSQKLEYTTGVVVPELRKSSHSAYPGFDLWLACMKNDPLAWVECEDYNRIDVKSMKAEYIKLRPWYSRHPNLAIFNEDVSGHTCPTCSSKNVKKDGLARTQVGIYQRYVCGDCGKYSRGRKLVRNQEERAHVLVN